MINYKKILVILPFAATLAFSQTGVDNSTITLGQSSALKGPAKALGTGMNQGAQSYFNHVNDNGGIHGRSIKLISYDDKYQPKKAIKNTNKLIKNDKVFALFGEVGTPTSKVVVPIAKEAGVLFLTPLTGAGFLRTPADPLIMNFRGSYDAETDALVEYFTTVKGFSKISIFYQNDGYGKAGLSGVLKAMKKRNIELVSQGHYKRNTLGIKKALKSIEKGNPEAIIMIGAYKPCAAFIKKARKSSLKDSYFANISFVGSKALVKNLKGNAKNVIISQVVPLPWDTTNPAVKEYQSIFKKYNKNVDFGFLSLEGFLSAKFVAKGIEKAGKELTTKSLMTGLESLDDNALDGLNISVSNNDHQAMTSIYLTEYSDGAFKQLKEIKE